MNSKVLNDKYHTMTTSDNMLFIERYWVLMAIGGLSLLLALILRNGFFTFITCVIALFFSLVYFGHVRFNDTQQQYTVGALIVSCAAGFGGLMIAFT